MKMDNFEQVLSEDVVILMTVDEGHENIFGVYSDRQSALLDFIENGCCLYTIDGLHFVDADVITYKKIEENTNENE